MAIREQILAEIQRRLYLVDGVNIVLRNPGPGGVPHVADLPAISIFAMNEDVINSSMQGDYPILAKVWPIIIVPYIVASGTTKDDEIAESEINPFLDLVRREIYRGGATLSGLASLVVETGTGVLIKPYVGEPGLGLPISFDVHYTDDVNDLFS